MRATLLQIHYHDRPGGVMRVMRSYAGVFCRIPHSCARFFYASDSQYLSDTSVFNCKQADYHVYRSARALHRDSERLCEEIEKQIVICGEGTVDVVAHNLTLGKNCALSMAFLDAARKMSDSRIRFVLVVHDCAEEGRVALLAQVQKACSLRGSPFTAHGLFPDRSYVALWTPSARLCRAFSQAGLPVVYMPNPVGDHTSIVKRLSRRSLFSKADEQGVSLDKSKPIVVYPVRILARKNVLEAVFLVSVLGGSNLLLGSSGAHCADRSAYNSVRRLIHQFELPVLVQAQMDKAGDCGFERILAASDAAVSTSVVEGFGYGLFDPFFSDRPLLGRIPAGFDYLDFPQWPWYYKKLLIPSDWVNLERLSALYVKRTGLSRNLCGAPVSRIGYRKLHLKDGLIDFGVLDTLAQVQVIKKVCRQETLGELVCLECEKATVRARGAISSLLGEKSTVTAARNDATKRFGLERFSRRLNNALGKSEERDHYNMDSSWKKVAQQVLKAGDFRFQLDGTL